MRQTGDGAWQTEQRGAVGGTRDVGFKGKVVGWNIKKGLRGKPRECEGRGSVE